MVAILITIQEARMAFGLKGKKTGIVTPTTNFRYNGRTIHKVEFARYDVVRYFDIFGACIGSFQDKCGLDD